MKPLTRVKVEKGQIWEHKTKKIKVIIVRGHGDEWLCVRVGNPKIQHHILTFDLYKYWFLAPDVD